MAKIVLPINPYYVELIMNGTKRYEFRKSMCGRPVDEIIIYATAPVSAVVGSVKVESIIKAPLNKVWEETKDYSGITKKFFRTYYNSLENAVAYKLGDVMKYPKPIALKEVGIKQVPRSHVYINEQCDEWKNHIERLAKNGVTYENAKAD